MGQEVMILIVLGTVLVVAGFVFMLSKGKSQPGPSETIGGNGTPSTPVEAKKVKRVEKPVDKHDMSGFIKFDKIANDMIYQNNGERYSMVLQCKGVNYHLMSEIEQMAVEEGFIMFLNTLKFPIQLYVQTRSVDLSENIKTYKDRVKGFIDKQNEVSAKCAEVEDDVDSTNEEISYMRKEKLKYTNIAEYVSDITRYVERMALNKHMLQRNFYIIFSYNKNELATMEKFTKEEYEDMCYRELYTRAQAIMGSLATCSVTSRVLTSNEVAQLIYSSLNKDDEKLMNIKDALEAGLFRLYTSSEDVLKKKREMLDAELQKEGMKRVEQVVEQARAKGMLVTEAESEEAVQKEIDKRAIKIIDQSEVDEKVKNTLKDVIKDNRRERVKKMNEALGRTENSEKKSVLMQDSVLTANDVLSEETENIGTDAEARAEAEQQTPSEPVMPVQEPVVEMVEEPLVQEQAVVDVSEPVIETPVVEEPVVENVVETPAAPQPFSPLAGMDDLLDDEDDDDMIIGTKEGESTNEG